MTADAGERHGSEQQRAVEKFRALAAPSRFRVQEDAERFPVIPGRYGQIEWYCDGVNCHSCALPGEFALAVYSDHPRVFARLWAIPGVKRHQTGDTEMRAVFLPDVLEPVAAVIKAYRQRTLTPEVARKLGAKTAYRATSAGQELRTSASEGKGLGEAMSDGELPGKVLSKVSAERRATGKSGPAAVRERIRFAATGTTYSPREASRVLTQDHTHADVSIPMRGSTHGRTKRAAVRRIDTPNTPSVEYSPECSPAVDAWLDLLADLIADELLSERASRD